jgi:hypothetical protein
MGTAGHEATRPLPDMALSSVRSADLDAAGINLNRRPGSPGKQFGPYRFSLQGSLVAVFGLISCWLIARLR